MAISTVNIGSAPNDGTGDPLRTAFNKLNTNFLNITADGGNEITVVDPTTATDAPLNDALQNIFDIGGGTTPPLQSVIEAGDELVSDDNLRKIVISKEGQSISFYSRADVGDAWILKDGWDDYSIQIGASLTDGNRITLSKYLGLLIEADDGIDGIILNTLELSRTKDGLSSSASWERTVTSNTQASTSTHHIILDNAALSDPTGFNGAWFSAIVRNGTATIGGTAYGVGTLVYRVYHSGAWNNTVYIDQTQVVKANRYIYQGKTSVTGVTGETNICSFKIPAGDYSNTDAFKLDFTPTKSVTASTSTFKVYIGTTSGARTSTIAQTALGTTGRASDNTRRYFIDGGSLDCSVLFTTNANSGLGSQTSVNTPISVNMANDLWITITANPTATSEVHGVMGVSITPLK